jgi:peptidoglycan/LPS O-acetylase OafA/YrhL
MLLDPMRGIAAFWVFAFHYGFSLEFQENLRPLYLIARRGELGVAMFFVISGYCITASTLSSKRKTESVFSFLYRRLRRIYPPFWISIVVVAALPFLIEALSSLKTGTYIWPKAEQNVNLAFIDFSWIDWIRVASLTQVFHPEGNQLSAKFTGINAPYWSLAIEVQFYIVMAIALWTKSIYKTVLAVLIFSIPFACQSHFLRNGIFLPYWPMFFWGIVLCYLQERQLTVNSAFKRSAAIVSFVAIPVLVGLFLLAIALGLKIEQQLFAIAFAVFLWFAKVFDGTLEALTKSTSKPIFLLMSVLMTLGAMSYSVYLLHGRLQFLTRQVVRQFLVESVVSDLLILLVTLIACYPFYLCCEKPFIQGIPKRLARTDADSRRIS